MTTTTRRTVKAWVVSDRETGEIIEVSASRVHAQNAARSLYHSSGRNVIAEQVTLAVVQDER